MVEPRGVKPKDVFQPVRVALAGTTVSPGIFETLEVLGRDESLARIDAALRPEKLRHQSSRAGSNIRPHLPIEGESAISASTQAKALTRSL